MCPFFGLGPEHRAATHSQIFDLIMASKGGFDFTALYTMPLYLRRFYFKMMDKHIQEENERIESINKPQSPSPSKILGPMGRSIN